MKCGVWSFRFNISFRFKPYSFMVTWFSPFLKKLDDHLKLTLYNFFRNVTKKKAFKMSMYLIPL